MALISLARGEFRWRAESSGRSGAGPTDFGGEIAMIRAAHDLSGD
jgi:hypothetical protein